LSDRNTFFVGRVHRFAIADLEGFMSRLVVLMQVLGLSLSVAFGGESPTIRKDEAFKQEVERIADVLGYKDGLRISRTSWNGRPASSAVLWQTTWQLKAAPQSVEVSMRMEATAMKLPEAERLKYMNRFDDHIQIWGVELPANAEPLRQSGLVADDKPHRQHRELFYLGRDKNFAWYGFMPIYDFAHVERQLSLKGEDVLPALLRGVAIEDLGSCTRNSCEGWLSREGARALKAINDAIAARRPQRARLVAAMGRSRDETVTRWLIGLLASTDADVAGAARNAFLGWPREDAAPLYAKWLADGAGQRDVTRELEVCRQVKVAQAASSLPKVLAAPASVKEYRLALEMSHEFAGKPAMPADALAAEERIYKLGGGNGPGLDEAVDAILAAAPAEDAAAIGMSLALPVGKMSESDENAIQRAGVQILRRVPGGEGKRLARLLARTNRADWQAAEVKAAAEAIDSQ
jgi:hypothetical protein